MSGDVQPRKRKDKRRKKADGDYHIQRIRGTSFDEDDVGTPPPTLINPSSENSTDNVTIHVHKEGGTGGHWCARIIFFALLSVLVGLVGIIIIEHRGSTDVDTPISDSRWAMIFDGWVDDIIPQHDEEPHEEASEENGEHDEEETEEDEKGDHEKEEEEEEEEEETEENVADKDSPEVDKEEDEGIGSEEEEQEEEEEEDNGSEHDSHDDDEDRQSSEEDRHSVEEEIFQKNGYASRREVTSKMAENDEGFDEDDSVENSDDFGTLEELENASDEDTNEDETMNNSEENEAEEEDYEVEQEQDEEEEDKEKEEADNMDHDLDVSIDGVRASKEDLEEDDVSQEYFSIPGVGEIDENSVEPLEEIEESDLEEIVNELEIEPDEEQQIEEETSSVAVKIGVGVALIVAAHFVLVRRWNNVEADLAGGSYGNEAVDLARRNTIVPPLNPKNLITKNENESAIKDEKIAETYEQLGDKYRSLETENVKGSSKGEAGNPQLRHVAMQQKASYEAKGTSAKIDARAPKKEEETEETMTSESERQSATEAEEDDEEVSEEEDEEDEDEELEDEEIEEPDDSELVAKLEAKYGKLPTPTESEDEEDYEDEDEEDEEDEEAEDEDAEVQGWKPGVKAPKGPRPIGPAVEQRREARGKDQTQKSSGGSQSADKNVHGSGNDSSFDEVSIQEEINNWLSKEFDN